jgi:hypothetical protein
MLEDQRDHIGFKVKPVDCNQKGCTKRLRRGLLWAMTACF